MTKICSSAYWSPSRKESVVSSASVRCSLRWTGLNHIQRSRESTEIKMGRSRRLKFWSSSGKWNITRIIWCYCVGITELRRQLKLIRIISSDTLTLMTTRGWHTRIWCKWSCHVTISTSEQPLHNETSMKCLNMTFWMQRLRLSWHGCSRSKWLHW